MPNTATIEQFDPKSLLRYGSPPLQVNKRNGQVQIMTARGMMVNSLLRKDEWETLTDRVLTAAKQRTNMLEHLRSRSLVIAQNIGTIVSQWNKSSEMTEAEQSISGQATGGRDRVDFMLDGVTVPITFKEFQIGMRELDAARLMGNGIETITAVEAAQVVAEKIESVIVDGSTLKLSSATQTYGYTNHPQRKTDTAANYGGGDWGTISLIVPTVAGMIGAISTSANRYHGPYGLYVAPVQFNQASTEFFSDGSGESALDRIKRMPQIDAVYPNDTLADGEVLLVQLTEDVVDYVEEMPITVVEWASPEGSVSHFKVMFAGAPRVKADYDDRTGIVHATGA